MPTYTITEEALDEQMAALISNAEDNTIHYNTELINAVTIASDESQDRFRQSVIDGYTQAWKSEINTQRESVESAYQDVMHQIETCVQQMTMTHKDQLNLTDLYCNAAITEAVTAHNDYQRQVEQAKQEAERQAEEARKRAKNRAFLRAAVGIVAGIAGAAVGAPWIASTFFVSAGAFTVSIIEAVIFSAINAGINRGNIFKAVAEGVLFAGFGYQVTAVLDKYQKLLDVVKETIKATSTAVLSTTVRGGKLLENVLSGISYNVISNLVIPKIEFKELLTKKQISIHTKNSLLRSAVGSTATSLVTRKFSLETYALNALSDVGQGIASIYKYNQERKSEMVKNEKLLLEKKDKALVINKSKSSTDKINSSLKLRNKNKLIHNNEENACNTQIIKKRSDSFTIIANQEYENSSDNKFHTLIINTVGPSLLNNGLGLFEKIVTHTTRSCTSLNSILKEVQPISSRKNYWGGKAFYVAENTWSHTEVRDGTHTIAFREKVNDMRILEQDTLKQQFPNNMRIGRKAGAEAIRLGYDGIRYKSMHHKGTNLALFKPKEFLQPIGVYPTPVLDEISPVSFKSIRFVQGFSLGVTSISTVFTVKHILESDSPIKETLHQTSLWVAARQGGIMGARYALKPCANAGKLLKHPLATSIFIPACVAMGSLIGGVGTAFDVDLITQPLFACKANAINNEKSFLDLSTDLVRQHSQMSRVLVLKNLKENMPHTLYDDRVIGWCDITSQDRESYAHSGIFDIGVVASHRGKGIGSPY